MIWGAISIESQKEPLAFEDSDAPHLNWAKGYLAECIENWLKEIE